MNWWETTIVIAAGVLTLFNLVDKIVNAVKATKSPIAELERRVECLERSFKDSKDNIFPKYDSKISDIEEGNRVTQKAILALLTHSIDGNNVDEMKEAKRELQDYLLKK